MAWSTPSSRSAGYVVPHTVWNQDVVDNPVALRGGAIAISGQAAEQLIKASSASQLSYVTVPARGAVLYAGASGAPGWLAAGADGYVLTAAGAGADPAWEAPAAALDRDVSAFTVNGDGEGTTETTVYTYSVPGGTLSTNRKLRVTMQGDAINNTGGNRNFRVRVKYGSTTVFDTGAVQVGTSASRSFVWLCTDLMALNSASAQIATSRFQVGQGGGVAGVGQALGGGGVLEYCGVHNAVAEASAGALNLVITVELSNTDATLDFVCRTVLTELL